MRAVTRAWLIALLLSACATTHETAVPPMALAGAPLPWPPSLADLTWIEGRWAGRDEAGTCHIEHWLGARAGLLWRIARDGERVSVTPIRLDDARIGTRELVYDGRRYTLGGDQLRVDARASLTLEPAHDLTDSCPPP